MNVDVLLQLVLILAPLSLVAVGGISATLPEVYRQVVDVNHWLAPSEFATLYTLAQVAPGPNAIVISLIGWKLAGWAGAFTAILAVTLPSSVLTYLLTRARGRLGRAPWLHAVQGGLAPVAVGLVLANGLILARATDASPLAYLVTGVTMVLVVRSRLHPLMLMGVGAALGVGGWL